MVPLPAPIPEGLVSPTPDTLLIEGSVATGKTQALVEHVAGLVHDGARADDILVFCATPSAAAQFGQRLTAACPAESSRICVTTPRAWCLDVLSEPTLQAAVGRRARLLAPFEVDILMEDMKTGGVRPKRLREMLRFFYKSLTELCDWEGEDWLVTGEEDLTYRLLQDCLASIGAVLEPELANKVARCLFADAGELARHARAHVVVDDYQMLSRASQVLANKLATRSLAVAANPALCIEVFDSYPYGAGIEELRAANPGLRHRVLTTSHACACATQAANTMISRVCPGAPLLTVAESAPGNPIRVIHAATPSQEREQVAQVIQDALVRGVHPGDIAVVVPNRTWTRAIGASLTTHGIPVEAPCDPRSVSGDPRTLDRCLPARILTALYLVADPTDLAAWRSWCGFGDHFACSSAFKDIRTFADERGLSLDAALVRCAQIAQESGANRSEHAHVEAAVASAQQLLEETAMLAGDELLRLLTERIAGRDASVPPVVRDLVAPLVGNEDACASDASAVSMAWRARQRLCLPCIESGASVHLTSLAGVTGLSPRLLVLCGFVNGFFPSKGVLDREILSQEDADKQMAKDLRALINAAGKATEGIIVTVFDETSLEVAERLKMSIARIQLRDGVRVARSQPSAYLDLLLG